MSSPERIIAALERELRVGLFTWSRRAISLTDAGSDYLARVEPILETLNASAIWGKADIRKCGGDVRLWPIVLQKSFCLFDQKVSEPWARFSCKDVRGHMISR
jgi:hypothetical protein